MKSIPFQSMYGCAMTVVTALTLLMAVPSVTFCADAESAYTDADCIACHRTGSEESELQISVRDYEASVHAGETSCQECHTEVQDDEHQSIEGSGAVDCSACHEQENRHGLNGADEARPQCHDCHTRHNILARDDPTSTVHAGQLPVTCAACHPASVGKETFFSWFPAFRIASHNKADFGSTYEKDNCLGCHQGTGAHGETEAINAQTCHRCHVSADKAGAMWGRMHPQADMQVQPAVFAAASIYQVAMVIGLILLAGRFFRRRRPTPAGTTDTKK